MWVCAGFAVGARRGLHAATLRSVPLGQRYQHTHAVPVQSWLDPVARYVLSAPETMGLLGVLPYPYTTSIILMTLVLRAGVSLPVALWQRARNERLTNIVLPEWGVWKKQIPAAAFSRQASNNFADGGVPVRHVQQQIRKSLKEKWHHLVRLHDCSPSRTTVGSLLAHVPLFIVVTMLLRQAALLPDSPLIHELIPWWSPDATFAAQTAATKQILMEKGLDAASIERLTRMGGPTLADRDSTQIMPIVVGSLNLLNVELSQWTRQHRLSRERELGLGDSPPSANEAGAVQESPRERVLGNVLRIGAVVSIPIACQVPSALLVYWATSALATMTQNGYFAWLETKNK